LRSSVRKMFANFQSAKRWPLRRNTEAAVNHGHQSFLCVGLLAEVVDKWVATSLLPAAPR
jgi:hypothetical protein